MEFLQTVDTCQCVTAILACLTVLACILLKIRQANTIKLPPGPSSLPIIGNLHMLGKLPHRTLRDFSQKYGPLMFIRLGCVPTVVVSSAAMAQQFLKTHDLTFASRPRLVAAENMFYNSTDVGFCPYGPYWKQMRKVCMLQLLNSKTVESFQSVREAAVSLLINSILNDSHRGLNPVNVSKALLSLPTDIICRMAFGRKHSADGLDNSEFRAIFKEFMFCLGAFSIGDYIPYMEWLDLQGLKRRQLKVHKTFDVFFEKIVGEHELQNNPQRDFVDVLLTISQDKETQVTRDNIKALILDMFFAGAETSSVVLEWAMSEVLKNPSVMKKAQEELERVVGRNRLVQESDRPNLPYLQSVVKETLRLHTPLPLLAPRESMESCNVWGYDIPAKTRVLVNAWAIARDSKLWEDAETFKPERFITSCMDVRGQNFELIPFGSGRRGCPGMHLGMVVVELALAQLLHCFDWRLPDGMNVCDLDMTEDLGITAPRAAPLLSIPTPRLPVI